MNISHLTSDSIRRLLPLSEKRDEILKSLRAIETDIADAIAGTASAILSAVTPDKPKKSASKAASKSSSKGASKRRAGKGKLKDRILDLLGSAGAAGLTVKDLAKSLGVKPGNVYVWFGSTGKPLTKKVAPGRYAVKGAASAAQPATKEKVQAKPARKKSNMSPEGRARIAAASKARWAAHRAAKAGKKPAKKAAKVKRG